MRTAGTPGSLPMDRRRSVVRLFRDTSRKSARWPGDAAMRSTAQPWDDDAGKFGEFMARGRLETDRRFTRRGDGTPRSAPLPSRALHVLDGRGRRDGIFEDEMPAYQRWKPPPTDAPG